VDSDSEDDRGGSEINKNLEISELKKIDFDDKEAVDRLRFRINSLP
jgi:hypothetical protein